MLPSLHRLRLHDAAPVGAKNKKKKVHNPQRKAKHDAKVALAAAAAKAQRAKVAALVEETLNDDARLEIMKQLVGCPPYGQAMSDLDALISTDSKFAALARDNGVWKELFPALMKRRTALDLGAAPLAGWLPRMDAFERSMTAGEFTSWYHAYTVLCKFMQLYELMQYSFDETTYRGRPRWWPELVMYESDSEYEYPWVDSDGNEDEDFEPRGPHEHVDYGEWRNRHDRVVNMGGMDIRDVKGVLDRFDHHIIINQLRGRVNLPVPADATVRRYIGAVWQAFVEAATVDDEDPEAHIASYFLGGGLGELVHDLIIELTPEQLWRPYEYFDGPDLFDADGLRLREWERLQQGEAPYTWARVNRERYHFMQVDHFLRSVVQFSDERAMWDDLQRVIDTYRPEWDRIYD